MKRTIFAWLFTFVAIIGLLAVTGAFYTVQETEQAVITQFGQPVGDPIRDAGLHFKIPFVQTVNGFDKRVLQWDGPATEMPTEDKLYIIVDAFARWRISDPLQYFLRLTDERTAHSRLDDILGGDIRNTVARHKLVEMIRTTKDRKPVQDDAVTSAGGLAATLPPIEFGRVKLEEEVAAESKAKLAEFGIELLDIRFKRIDYNRGVAAKIFERMISERRQIAERSRSEGAGEAARIMGSRQRDINQIESDAYRQVQAIQGKADGEATAIYAQAFNQSPEARDFYAFQRSMEAYRTTFQKDTTVILTTDNAFLKYLQDGTAKTPVSDSKPQPQPGAPPQ